MPDTESPSGIYYSWLGIKEVLGTENAITQSQLEAETFDPDYTRIIADGTEADAYTNRRARRGNNQYRTPIPSTSADFTLIQRATNLYAAFQLVRHRIWFGAEGDDVQARAMLSLRKQYMEFYDALFGPMRDGVDGAELVDGAEAQPGTMINVGMRFEPEAIRADEYTS